MMLPLLRLLWLLLCYAQYARSTVLDYDWLADEYFHTKELNPVIFSNDLGVDKTSGCRCRSSVTMNVIDCFGGYDCKRFPKAPKTESLKVRTSSISRIQVGDLDKYYFLRNFQLEANHQLSHIEPGSFKNLTNLEQLSISYSVQLFSLHERTFEGLVGLTNLTLVNNAFFHINYINSALGTTFLPSLMYLDLSENLFEKIDKNSFISMKGTQLKRLELNLCQMGTIHPDSLSHFKTLEDLIIGENELDANQIADVLTSMNKSGVNLLHLDLSGMAFRRHPPKSLLEIIANTTIQKLVLAKNQFELILDTSFPTMENLVILDLRKASVVFVEAKAFDPSKFPKLKALLLSYNYLAGIHSEHTSTQLQFLDLSHNTETVKDTIYFDIIGNTFGKDSDMRILNLSYNTIRSVHDYTFTGLQKLQCLDMQNGALFRIGNGTFAPTTNLEILNLANNPLSLGQNITTAQFKGLNKLKVLILNGCGLKYLDDKDNIFTAMPNLRRLLLKENQLNSITAKLLEPMKYLEELDLSENLIVAWNQPLLYPSNAKLKNLNLQNNKLSHLSTGMLDDLKYLLENNTAIIDLSVNLFVCECHTMAYSWMETNSSHALKQYITHSNFKCSTPDIWEGRTVGEYFKSMNSVRCIIYNKLTSAVVMVWTAPTVILILILISCIILSIKYRVYIKYWLFLTKLALGRRFSSYRTQVDYESKVFKYDAFVSYSNEDRDLVLEIASRMEMEEPYLKLCIYERDFEIGSFISESILSSINESKYILLIVSNSFVKSQWCRWETQLAEYHSLFLEDGSVYDPLILIKVGEIENKYLNPTLKYLLKTKVYLTWNGTQSDFWHKLKTILSRK